MQTSIEKAILPIKINELVQLILLLKLAKQLNFSAKQISSEELEELGIAISIDNGLKTGLLNDIEKQKFLTNLNTDFIAHIAYHHDIN